MARKSKEAAGWGFRLAAIFITLVLTAGVFAYAFASTGNEFKSMIRAAIPFGSALVVSYLLGSISKLSHTRWQIFLTVLLMVAVIVCLRIAGVI